MADFTALKTAIQTYIKENGNEEITGEKLQEILLSMVTTLGDSAINDLITALNNEVAARQNADGTLQQNITNEATARGNADTALGGRIDDEETARASGDTALSNRLGSTITAEDTAADQIGAEAEARTAADTALLELIDGITDNIENGYVYAGIATPSSTPASGKVFYLALTAGTYTNFGSTVVSQGINILKYNGSAWSLDAFIGIDDELTPSSNKLPKSGNVLENIIKNGSAFDLSAYNAVDGVLATYADLSAALTVLNALPAVYKQGGMSFRFVHTSDNKYVRYNLLANSFTTDTTQWAIDDAGVYVENPEFIRAYTDKDGKVLWAIETNGNIRYGAGVPQQVIDYVQQKIDELSLDEYEDIVAFLGSLINGDKTLQQLLDEKVDKIDGKSLVDDQYHENLDNPEYIQVMTDSDKKVLSGIKPNGKYVYPTQQMDDLENIRESFLQMTVDKDGKIIEAVDKDGKKHLPVPTNQDDIIMESLQHSLDFIDIRKNNFDYHQECIFHDNFCREIEDVSRPWLIGSNSSEATNNDTYKVKKTTGLTEQPTGTELSTDPNINSGTYKKYLLYGVFPDLPTAIGDDNAITYWMVVIGNTTTYTKWVVTLEQISGDVYKYDYKSLVPDSVDDGFRITIDGDSSTSSSQRLTNSWTADMVKGFRIVANLVKKSDIVVELANPTEAHKYQELVFNVKNIGNYESFRIHRYYRTTSSGAIIHELIIEKTTCINTKETKSLIPINTGSLGNAIRFYFMSKRYRIYLDDALVYEGEIENTIENIGLMVERSRNYSYHFFNIYYVEKDMLHIDTAPVIDKGLVDNGLLNHSGQSLYPVPVEPPEDPNYAYNIVSDVVDYGMCERFEIKYANNLNVNSDRQENTLLSPYTYIPILGRYVVSFDFMVPADFVGDNYGETVFQLHEANAHYQGPCNDLTIKPSVKDSSKWAIYIGVASIVEQVIPARMPKKCTQEKELCFVEPGKWHHFELMFKQGYIPEHNPLTIVKVDEVELFRSCCPNAYNVAAADFPKYGIYKALWMTISTNTTQRITYFDNFQIKY